jgi:hypothetical protein
VPIVRPPKFTIRMGGRLCRHAPGRKRATSSSLRPCETGRPHEAPLAGGVAQITTAHRPTNRPTNVIRGSTDIGVRRCQGRTESAVLQLKSLLIYGLGLPDVHAGDGALNDETVDLIGPFEDRVGTRMVHKHPGTPIEYETINSMAEVA